MLSNTLMFFTLTSINGLSFSSVLTLSISDTTSYPLETLPNTVCLLFNHGAGTVVIKNCEAFVPGPAFAIDNING